MKYLENWRSVMEYTFFSSARGTLAKIIYLLSYNPTLNISKDWLKSFRL